MAVTPMAWANCSCDIPNRILVFFICLLFIVLLFIVGTIYNMIRQCQVFSSPSQKIFNPNVQYFQCRVICRVISLISAFATAISLLQGNIKGSGRRAGALWRWEEGSERPLCAVIFVGVSAIMIYTIYTPLECRDLLKQDSRWVLNLGKALRPVHRL